MEEDLRKQGMLYLQQQRFGKRWKRVWAVLYRENARSISRLEFFECKDGGSVEKNDRSQRKHLEHKKVVRLADCIRVSEVELDGCPRDTGPFLIETTEKIHLFAADRQQLDDWMHKLCEVAFPMNWTEPSMKRGLQREGSEEGMEENFLYSGRQTGCVFSVCVRRTAASERCRLQGDYLLQVEAEALQLQERRSGTALLAWPYRYLRRFGRDKTSFSFEAGRRCPSGEGSFEFDTKQGHLLFKAVEAAISRQQTLPQVSGGEQGAGDRLPELHTSLERPLPRPLPRSHAPQAAEGVYSTVDEPLSAPMVHHRDQQRPLQSLLEPPMEKPLTSMRSLNLDVRIGGGSGRKTQVKMMSSCPLPQTRTDPGPGSGFGSGSQSIEQASSPPSSAEADPEYSLPFDTVTAGAAATGGVDASVPGPDPLYDSIDEMLIRNIFLSDGSSAPRKVEHIYDEPEGCAAPCLREEPTSVYDDLEEMRGDAWRLMAAEPRGHNPKDDYAVPQRRPRKAHSITEEEESVE